MDSFVSTNWLTLQLTLDVANHFMTSVIRYNQMHQTWIKRVFSTQLTAWTTTTMDLLPDTKNCALRMRRKCRERYPRHWLQSKPLVGDPGMHHSTCVTHVPWCMSGSLTRSGGEKFPAYAQPAILRIWKKFHANQILRIRCLLCVHIFFTLPEADTTILSYFLSQ